MSIAALAQSLEQSRLAAWVNSSAFVLGAISGLHLIGFTILAGAALVCALHLSGLAFADSADREVSQSAVRAMTLGLLLSVTTGIMQLAPRAQSTYENSLFLSKMGLLAAAVVVQAVVSRRAARGAAGGFAGVLSACLWVGVGVLGCAFILLE